MLLMLMTTTTTMMMMMVMLVVVVVVNVWSSNGMKRRSITAPRLRHLVAISTAEIIVECASAEGRRRVLVRVALRVMHLALRIRTKAPAPPPHCRSNALSTRTAAPSARPDSAFPVQRLHCFCTDLINHLEHLQNGLLDVML